MAPCSAGVGPLASRVLFVFAKCMSAPQWRKTFSKDGFDDGVEQVTSIEQQLAVDPTTLTALPPPKVGRPPGAGPPCVAIEPRSWRVDVVNGPT